MIVVERGPQQPSRTGIDSLGFHMGSVLWRFATDYYDTLMLTIIEAIQNGIDADATSVLVGIDLKESRVVIADNGTGIKTELFRSALQSIAKTVKKTDRMGRFGLGLISPLNKCQRFTITSQPQDPEDGRPVTHRWTFVGKEIREQHDNVAIVYERVSAMPGIPTPFRSRARHVGTTWNTIVQLEEVTADKAIRTINLDEFEAQIRIKLSSGMRRAGTTVHIVLSDEQGTMSGRQVNPLEYNGERLPVAEMVGADCGTIRFELYRANKTGGQRRGQVVVMQTGDNYPVSWKEFRAQAMGSRYLAEFPEAFNVLSSGHFEGVIYIERAELGPDRKKFILSEALIDSYMHIALWFEEHGQQYYEIEQEAQRDERYQRLGQESLDKLIQKLNDDPRLSMVLKELVGPGSGPARPRQPSSGTGSSSRKPRRTVVEPSGSRPSRPGSQPDKPTPAALRFAYEQRPAWDHLWEYDHDNATIVFNTLHPEWVRLDETNGKHTARHDQQIIHLQLWLGLEVVFLLSEYSEPENFELARAHLDKRVKLYSAVLIDRTPKR
jgi:hypothetical protein